MRLATRLFLVQLMLKMTLRSQYLSVSGKEDSLPSPMFTSKLVADKSVIINSLIKNVQCLISYVLRKVFTFIYVCNNWQWSTKICL